VTFPKNRGALIGIGIAVLVVGLIVLRVIQAGTTEDAAPTVEQIREEQGVPVTAATAVRADMDVWRSFNGTVSGVRDAVVRATSGDQVASVEVAVGQQVSRGQTLVRIAGDAAQARARQAEAAMRQAERTMNRLRPLHEAGAISDQEWENTVTAFEMARDDLAASREALSLTSPLAGTVTEVIARPGMIPSAGDPLVRVADLSQLVVRIHVSAPDARAINEGEVARIAAPDEPAGALSGEGSGPTGGATTGTMAGPAGEVRRVALQADPVSRLVEVEVAFPPGARLVPGTLERLEIRVGSQPDAIQVPRVAVRDGAVWVIGDDRRAARRPVTVGLVTPDAAEIRSGVEPGDRVVVRGASLLSDGALVRIIDDADGVS